MRKTSSLPNTGEETTDYPFGSIMDEDGEASGTPVVEATYSDFIQSLWHFFTKAGITPNGMKENTSNGFQLFEAMERRFTPLGVIKLWAGAAEAVPDGWLLCSGQALSATEYPELFAIIGYTYGGSGDSFNLPDLSDKFPLGAGGTRDPGDEGGEEEHTLSEDEMPAHKHKNGLLDDSGSIFVYGKTTEDLPGQATWIVQNGLGMLRYQGYTSEEGEGEAHNNMPPFLALSFIIKACYGAGLTYGG